MQGLLMNSACSLDESIIAALQGRLIGRAHGLTTYTLITHRETEARAF